MYNYNIIEKYSCDVISTSYIKTILGSGWSEEGEEYIVRHMGIDNNKDFPLW